MNPASMRAGRRLLAFSLIEVAVALGIASFALVTVVALLPAGLASTRKAHLQAQAAQNLNMIASCLQGAVCSSGSFTALAPFNGTNPGTPTVSITWSNTGGAAQRSNPIYLDESGWPTSDQSQASSLAVVEVFPGQGLSPARAHVAVAWPAVGTTVVSSGSSDFTLTKQDGSIETVVYINAQ